MSRSRSVSPLLRRQLHTFVKDDETCSSAVGLLKPFVECLDSQTIPRFVSEVYQHKDPNLSSSEFTISLYEVLAKLRGPEIVPQIDNIMSATVNTLMSSAGSFSLQLACSKVISAVATYGIAPTMSGSEKSQIICDLCRPLSDILMGSSEGPASGSALCLKALVDCENWSFASNELVNEVCLKVAGALEGSDSQTNFHMGLAISLANRNSFMLEGYARSIIRSGIRILESSSLEVNLHKRLTSIQMIISIMNCIDSRSFSSEVGNILDVMETFSLDPMECVRKAAFEASRTAKRMCNLKDPRSVTRSNFSKRAASRKNANFCWVRGKNYSRSPSPESRTFTSANDLVDLFEHSSVSSAQESCNIRYRSSPMRRLPVRSDAADVSFDGGLFSKVKGSQSPGLMQFHVGEENEEERSGTSICSRMAGMHQETRTASPSPERLFLGNSMDDRCAVTAPNGEIQCSGFCGELEEEDKNASPVCMGQQVLYDEDPERCVYSIQHSDPIEEQNMYAVPSVQNIPHIPGTQFKLVGNSAEQPRESTACRNGILVLVIGLCLGFAAIIFGLLSDEQGKFDAYPT